MLSHVSDNPLQLSELPFPEADVCCASLCSRQWYPRGSAWSQWQRAGYEIAVATPQTLFCIMSDHSAYWFGEPLVEVPYRLIQAWVPLLVAGLEFIVLGSF